MTVVLLIVAAYLIGSIPFGIIVGKMRGFDPRAVGSGNIGMTNVARAGGGSAAAITFLGDVLKGAIPVAIARVMGFPPAILACVGLAAFLGSIASVFLGFSGGKGISASLGVWAVLAPMAVLFAHGGIRHHDGGLAHHVARIDHRGNRAGARRGGALDAAALRAAGDRDVGTGAVSAS